MIFRILLFGFMILNVCGAQKPNVLFILADDMSYETVGAVGMEKVETPHLDRLYREGTVFTHAYNSGGWHGAICVASRTMMMTGRHLWYAAAEEKQLKKRKLLPQLMAEAGYRTYMTGKWHVRVDARDLFHAVGNLRRGGMPKLGPEGYGRPIEGQKDTWDPADPKFGGFWEGGKHWSEAEADAAIGFLKEAKGEESPFFIYLSFNAPHDPRQSPQEYLDRYPVEEVQVPKNYRASYPERKEMGAPHRLRDEKLAPMPRTEYAVRVARREYFAIITHLDAQIGRVLEALEQSGMKENTMVVFTADHGLSVGHHGLLGKQNMYDHSLRVPYVISGPGIGKGVKNVSPIYIQDSMPTCLEVAGLEVPQDVHYRSLIPLLQGGGKARTRIYSAYQKESQRAITEGGYKLILYPLAKKAKLFDLSKDPHEMVDLLEQGQGRQRAEKLYRSLKEEAEEHGDPFEYPGELWR